MKSLIFLFPLLLALGACSLLVDFEDEKSTRERDCDDGRDNDGDDMTDCDDQDCFEAENCTGPNVNNFNNLNNIVNPEDCENRQDDAGDGFVDCGDDDCLSDPACQGQREICDNNFDDDGDGYIDCGDPECFGPDCNVPGETDCGDGQDNEGDGMADCQDPDCADGIICGTGLQRCNDVVDHDNNWSIIYYYTDIYLEAESGDCPQNHYCSVKPEISWMPHCYPFEFTEVVPAYQPCGPSMPCGTGLACVWSDKLSESLMSEVCLPMCAPGFQDQCIGGTGLCYRHWSDFYDVFQEQTIELWLCDQPGCNPMNTTNNGCTQNQICYPATDLMGDAACHPTSGTVTIGGECFNDDLRCVPGAICRMGPDDNNVTRCHQLCKEGASCANGNPCIKEDNRQFFGFCP